MSTLGYPAVPVLVVMTEDIRSFHLKKQDFNPFFGVIYDITTERHRQTSQLLGRGSWRAVLYRDETLDGRALPGTNSPTEVDDGRRGEE